MEVKLRLLSLTIILGVLVKSVCSQKVGIRSSHAMACWLASQKWNFGCEKNVECLCRNNPFLGSVLDCVRDRLEEEPDINDAYQYIQNNCRYNGKIEYSFGKLDDIYYKATANIIKADNASLLADQNRLLTNSIETDQIAFDSHYRAAHTAKRQYELGTTFGCAMIGYWMAVAFLGVASHFILTLYPELLFANNKIISSIRKHLTLPAMFNGSHSRPVKLFHKLYLSAPTRGQSIILFGYFALNLVCLLIDYDIFMPDPFLLNELNQRLRYLGNRTGVISFTQIPVVILFAGRNNILIALTGWSYDTFQVYHRWVARVMMTHAIIHSVCFTWLAAIGHTVAYRWQEVINWRAGNIAVYSGCIMLIFSLTAFRSRFYEIFYLIHKCFYIIFIVGIARHCWDFGWMGWVYASIGVHALERFFRFARVVVSGFRNEAYAVLYPNNTFRLSVQYSKRWNVAPGQFCYVRVLTKDLFWQAHPFSVYSSPIEGDDSLNFAIKAKTGATKKIADYLETQPNKTAVLPVLIEGPYGVHVPVENYETVFLLAGGMGVTATYPYALYLKKLLKYSQKVIFLWVIQDETPLEWFGEEILSLATSPNIEVQIYITRKFNQPQELLEVNENGPESQAELGETGLPKDGGPKTLYTIQEKAEPNDEVIVYSGQHPMYLHTNQSSIPLQNYYQNNSQQDLSGFHQPTQSPAQKIRDQFEHVLNEGRPNIQEEVSRFMVTEKGSMALVSCGPPTFIDYIRKSVVTNIKKTQHRVDYFEEAFSW